jgi:hypothetical protein
MEIEKLLQKPENRVRWINMIKRQEVMRMSFTDRAREASDLIEQMKEESNVQTTKG